MRKPITLTSAVVLIGAVAVSFALGRTSAGNSDAPDAAAEDFSAPDFPVAIQRMWFPPIGDYVNDGEPLEDERFDELLDDLRVALEAEETLADFEAEAEIHLWGFMRRIAVPEVSDAQVERFGAFIAEAVERHPDHAAMLERQTQLMESWASASTSPKPPALTGQLVAPFGDRESYPEDGEDFTDAQVDRLVGV